MKLIADSGATKTDWVCIMADGAGKVRFSSAGYNPNYVSTDYIVHDICSAFPRGIHKEEVTEIYFYGSGVTKLLELFMESALRQAFPSAIYVYTASDLIGAARALLGNKNGLVLILGTGMNSGVYDGISIQERIGSLGFILGDEGSGAYIGKQLVRDCMRRNMPDNVYELVRKRISMSDDQLINQVYRQPEPNRFCAQFVPFIEENLSIDPYFPALIERSFNDLFQQVISRYTSYESYTLNCVGSIAYCFQDILRKIAWERYRMQVGTILRYPLDGLMKYHS